jgi:hypothetical protein
MTEATRTWSIWQALLNGFAWAFTRRSFHHFAELITAMALNVEGGEKGDGAQFQGPSITNHGPPSQDPVHRDSFAVFNGKGEYLGVVRRA